MNDFIYANKTELVFGKDAELKVGERLQGFGAKRVLICFGQGSAEKSGLLQRIESQLKKHGIDYVKYGGICANPLKSHTLQGVQFAKDNHADFILAIGGGSVIDAAKCIAAGAVNTNVWNFYDGTQSEDELTHALPVGAVLTIPAAGSEGSTASVIRDEKSGKKYAVSAEVLRPAFAFINPELCKTLPPYQIANGVSDILAHLMERYFSPQEDIILTDKLLTGAMQAMFEIAPKLYKNPQSYTNWAQLCLLGTLAHNGMLDIGRDIQDWATHQIENTFLSGVYNIAHGAGLSIIFCAWLKTVANTKPKKILQFCSEVLHAGGKDSQEIIANGIRALESFYTSLNLPITLFDVQINADEVKKLVQSAYHEKTILGGYGRLTKNNILQLIETAR